MGGFVFDSERISGEIATRHIAVRSEWPQTRKRNHPRSRLVDTTHVDAIAAATHQKCSAQVPNIFPSDERVAICEKVRPFAKEQFGRAAGDMSPLQLYAYFIQRVKHYLHIILAFSPIGSAFRDRLRLFPSLVNCCAIDWFTAWPGDALRAVAEKFLKEVSLSDEVRPVLSQRPMLFDFST